MTAPTDEPIVPDEPTEPVEPAEVEPEEEPTEPTEPVEDPEEPADEEAEELSPEALKSALAKVRKEAAASRTKLRDVEARLAEAKTPEQIEELTADLKKEAAEEARTLLVENVQLKHGLPDDLADLLKGSTREELDAHAQVLAKYAPSSEGGEDPDLGGGLDPTNPADGSFDHEKYAREMRASQRRGV